MDGGKFVFSSSKVVTGFILAVLSCGLFLAWGFFQCRLPRTPIRSASRRWSVPDCCNRQRCRCDGLGAGRLYSDRIAEAVRLKGIVFHMAAAGAIAFAIWTLGRSEAGSETLRPGSGVALAAGFVAGAVYWLVAGRTSVAVGSRPISVSGEETSDFRTSV